jgi:hypothetical protein
MRIALASLPLVIATSSILATTSLGQEEVDRATALEQLEQMERPDDPPLPPAQPVPGAAPSEPIRFGQFLHTQVNVDSEGANIPGDAANEPSIAVDPTDPLFLCIGWRQFDNVASNFRQAGVGYSTDGGRSWTFPGSLTPGVFRSDPVLSFDAEGNFTYNSLEGDFTIDVFRSTDQGQTWGPPVYAFGGDKQWMATDRTDGIGRGHIYSFWTGNANFTRSTNNGQSFTNPVPIPQSPRWGTMRVAPDGELFIVGLNSSMSSYVVARSTDAQDASDLSTSFTTSSVNLGGTVTYFTGPNPEGLLGQPWIEVDDSQGPTAGNLYICSSVNPSGSDPLDVHFVRSTNGGATWSTPLRLNDDGSTTAWQWFGTMSVAPNGRIDVVWNDTRNTGQQNRSELFYTSSTDGGVTWTPDTQISGAWDSWVGFPNQSKIGDYYHMRSDLVGADLAWAATFNGEQDVYYTRIGDHDCNQNGVSDEQEIAGGAPDSNGNGILDECEGIVSEVIETEFDTELASSPNPFRGSTTIRFQMPESGRAAVRIFTASGQLVKTLFEGEAAAGINEHVWDGTDAAGERVPAGLYFTRVSAPGMKDSRRVILIN